MPVLKCTRKLVRALGKSADKLFSAQPDNDTSILGCWSAHLVIFARIRFVLFVNAKTLLTIFIPFKPKERLLQRFQPALLKELLRLGVLPDKAVEETSKFRNFSLGKNTDKSVVGSMNELAFEYKILLDLQVKRHGTLDLEAVQALANETPHVKREHSFPEEYVHELFDVEKPKVIFH
ncbi:MAG: hypothetical protein ABII89_02315 [Candidatus Omnitrophota bacterium]